MVKILLAAVAALILSGAPSVFAGHGGGELLRSPAAAAARR